MHHMCMIINNKKKNNNKIIINIRKIECKVKDTSNKYRSRESNFQKLLDQMVFELKYVMLKN